MTIKYVYIAPFIQKCFRDYIWREMWQLFNSCTATLHISLAQEVNKNSVSTRNSRGYLGRRNIIAQIGTCPESEDLHTCAYKKCRGSLCEPLVSSFVLHPIQGMLPPATWIPSFLFFVYTPLPEHLDIWKKKWLKRSYITLKSTKFFIMPKAWIRKCSKYKSCFY